MWRIPHIRVNEHFLIEFISFLYRCSYTCYRCTGDVTEWTKCSYSTTTPNRKAFDIPNDIKSEYDAL